MPRMARLVVPGYPHHVVQRGNHKETVFFNDRDRRIFLELLQESKEKAGFSIWAYCLMPNHVHLVVVPEKKDSLSKGLSVIHRHYARRIHLRREWKGFLWQGRFYSCALDEYHLYAALRYVELNPVRAGLARNPADYPWSSARAHLLGENDPMLSSHEGFTGITDWGKFLGECLSDDDIRALRIYSQTGRPLGDERFIRRLESLTGRRLTRTKPGPKPGVMRLSKELKEVGSLFGADELR